MSDYDKTMERLRRVNGGRPVTDKTAIVMLSHEIEEYRAQIQRLRGMSTKLLTEDIVRTDIFAKNVKRLLDEKCMRQRELADAAGVTEVAMSRYLNDGRMPKGPILYNMAKVLGVSVDDLLADPEEKDCTSCEYGPVWNDVCRTCRGTGHVNADPEEKAAGSGAATRRTEAESIKDQLVRKGDVFGAINDIVSVPYNMQDADLGKVQLYIHRYMSDFASRIRNLPAEGTAEPREHLNTCPFCGGTAHLEEATEGLAQTCAWIECNRCGARTRKYFGTSERVTRAIKAWNGRLDQKDRETTEELIKTIEDLQTTISNLLKTSISADRAEEIAEDAARKFKRAALQEIEKLEIPLLRTQDPYMQFKFSGMGEAHAAIRNLPPDIEE